MTTPVKKVDANVTMTMTSEAETIVRDVASSIGWVDQEVAEDGVVEVDGNGSGGGNSRRSLDELCRLLKQEFVCSTQQLRFIDSVQWNQQLKAPVGFVAALRKRLEELEDEDKDKERQKKVEEQGTGRNYEQQKQQEFLPPRAKGLSRRHLLDDFTNGDKNKSIGNGNGNYTKTNTGSDPSNQKIFENDNKSKSFKNVRKEDSIPGLGATVTTTTTTADNTATSNSDNDDDDLVGKIEEIETVEDSHRSRFWFDVRHFQALDFVYPFDHRLDWKRGVVESLSDRRLHLYVLNASEMWFICQALFVGSVLALWEIFPDLNGGTTPSSKTLHALAVVFNISATIDMYFAMCGLCLFGVIHIVTSAIDTPQIKPFVKHMYMAWDTADWYLCLSLELFFVNLLLCFYCRVVVVLDGYADEYPENNDLVWPGFRYTTISALAFLLVAILGWTFYNINVMGKIPFFCGMLAPSSPSSSNSNNNNGNTGPAADKDDVDIDASASDRRRSRVKRSSMVVGMR